MSILIRGETIDVAPHRHHALQVSLGLDGPFDFACGGQSSLMEGVVVDSGVLHRLDSKGSEIAVLLLEPEQACARHIKTHWLGDGACAAIPADIANEIRALFAKPGHMPLPDDIVRMLAPETKPLPQQDSRIAGLLVYLRALPEKRVTLAELAQEAGLSEGRLTHLFKEQTGVPIRRYLLWLRLNDAMNRAMAGVTLTEAAHAAGFSDSAHLSRTCVEMFGINPFAVVRHSQFFQAQKGSTP